MDLRSEISQFDAQIMRCDARLTPVYAVMCCTRNIMPCWMQFNLRVTVMHCSADMPKAVLLLRGYSPATSSISSVNCYCSVNMSFLQGFSSSRFLCYLKVMPLLWGHSLIPGVFSLLSGYSITQGFVCPFSGVILLLWGCSATPVSLSLLGLFIW